MNLVAYRQLWSLSCCGMKYWQMWLVESLVHRQTNLSVNLQMHPAVAILFYIINRDVQPIPEVEINVQAMTLPPPYAIDEVVCFFIKGCSFLSFQLSIAFAKVLFSL